jgi:hypothetical protein
MNFIRYIYSALHRKSGNNQRMHKIIDMYKIWDSYICFSKWVAILPPEDGNLFAETYVGGLKYILYMSIILCICWLILDIWHGVFGSEILINITKDSTQCSSTYGRNLTPSTIYVLCTTMESNHDFLPCNQHSSFQKMLTVITYRSQNSKIT